MKKTLIVGLFLGLLGFVSHAEAGYVTSKTTGAFLVGGSSIALTGYEQIDVTGVRVGSATQILQSQQEHYLLLIDTHTGVANASQTDFNDCHTGYPVGNRISAPIQFASSHTALGDNSGNRSAYIEFPPGVTIQYGLVACQEGGDVAAGVGGEFTVYFTRRQ